MRIDEKHPLWRHFSAQVEHAFYTKMGMCNPALTKYLADLLVTFTHIDYLNALRRIHGKRLEQIATMLLVLSDAMPEDELERDRTMYRKIGDYVLFWAGVYPEQLGRFNPEATDVLQRYIGRGKRSYEIVANLASENDAPPSSLFRDLSEDFEYCLYGLGLVRREWEKTPRKPGTGPSDLVY